MQVVPVWHRRNTAEQLHLDAMGCMGSASSLGLGLALGAPSRKVAVLDGDGSLMMQLGTLVTVGTLTPENFYHFVFDNGSYETSGNQPVPGSNTASIAALATASGYAAAHALAEANAFEAEIESILSAPGPAMIVLEVEREEACRNWPSLSMKEQVKTLRRRLEPA